MEKLTKLDNALTKIEIKVLVGLVGVMVTLSFLQVILRLFAGKSILWLDPMLRYFVLWAGFLGASVAVSGNKHFALDIFTGKLKGKKSKFIHIINKLFTAAVCTVLLTAAIRFVQVEISFQTTLFSIGNWQMPALYMEFMMPLGFMLIIFHTIVQIFKKRQE